MTGPRGLLFILLSVAILGVVACGGSSAPTPGVTATAPPSATEAAPSSPQPTSDPAALLPDGDRILEDVRHLSETIGPRPAGTAREKEAADFIAERLRGLGYEVSLQEFSLGRETARSSSLAVTSPEQRTIATVPFERSANGALRLSLAAAGIGRPEDFPSSIAGHAALIERGDLLFNDKVKNAQAAGARAALIYNNEAGIYYGSLQDSASIPVIAISQMEGQKLAESLRNGDVEVEVVVGSLSDAVSYNVVARPPRRDCDTVSGGHYDSVPQAPGASDNATGTATILEIASVLSRSGRMEGHCFVLFGSEELGLIGSRAYVNALDQAARDRLKAMLNFDMVGVGDETWLLIGTPALQQRASGIASGLGIGVARGNLPSTTSSDHASFINAGIPSLMFHRTEDPLLHTPEDVTGRVEPQLLEEAARMGVAMLESLNAGG
ncbi:MAG: M28 family peptidase [Dehalococcoidia bacterium]|nr:M28 family peptidase [Dehalococcoidia bacterium]